MFSHSEKIQASFLVAFIKYWHCSGSNVSENGAKLLGLNFGTVYQNTQRFPMLTYKNNILSA